MCRCDIHPYPQNNSQMLGHREKQLTKSAMKNEWDYLLLSGKVEQLKS